MIYTLSLQYISYNFHMAIIFLFDIRWNLCNFEASLTF